MSVRSFDRMSQILCSCLLHDMASGARSVDALSLVLFCSSLVEGTGLQIVEDMINDASRTQLNDPKRIRKKVSESQYLQL